MSLEHFKAQQEILQLAAYVPQHHRTHWNTLWNHEHTTEHLRAHYVAIKTQKTMKSTTNT